MQFRRRQFGIAKLDTSQNLTSFLSIKLPTQQNFQLDKTSNSLIRPVSPHIKVFSSVEGIFLLPILVLLSGDRCRDGSCLPRPQRYCQMKKIARRKMLCIRVPPPHYRIGRPHVFLNLTSLELPAAALGGVRTHKNCHLFGIVDVLELQNTIILLHQEDKEDINRLVLKLLKIYDVKKSTMSKTLQ